MDKDKNVDMANTAKEKANVILNLTSDIDVICAPLYSLGVTYFSYTRIGHDGSRLDLNNHPTMAEQYYIKSNHYEDSHIESNPFAYEPGFILWSTLQHDKTIQTCREHFNIDHGITLINQEADYCELWHFASTRNNYSIVNFYLNNMDLLKFFTFYFRDKCKAITKNLMSQKIQIVSSLPENMIKKTESISPTMINKNEILQNLQANRYYLGSEYGNTYLTRRELECLMWCIKGKTASETAQIVGISERTVEVHLNTVKQKFNCYKQVQLAQKAIKLGLIQI